MWLGLFKDGLGKAAPSSSSNGEDDDELMSCGNLECLTFRQPDNLDLA